MAALNLVRLRLEGHAIGNWWRRGRRVMSDLREWLALELRWHHVSLNAVSMWRRAVLIILVRVVIATVEIRGSLVLVWTTMLPGIRTRTCGGNSREYLRRCICGSDLACHMKSTRKASYCSQR
jgi:hypothetical protein